MAEAESSEQKHAGGRPLKFQSVEELQQKIDEYFSSCDPHVVKSIVRRNKVDGTAYWAEDEVITEQKPYTVSGLARALGTTRDLLLDYEAKAEFSDTIKAAKERVHQYAEEQLFGRAAHGAAFSLKNNWGWKDKSEIDHTTKGQAMPLLGGTTPMVEEEDGDAEPATT